MGRFPPRRNGGATTTENIIILSLVAIACLVVVTAFGRQLANLFTRSSSALGTGSVQRIPYYQDPGGYVGVEFYGTAWSGEVVKEFDPGSTLTPADRLQAARDLLNATPEGRAALQYLQSKGVTIRLLGGGGSYYSPDTGQITVDPAYTATGMAQTIIHEANHARYHKDGIGANIMTDTRADYVRRMLAEETVGTVAAIELKRRLEAQGYHTWPTPGEEQYDAAYRKAVADLRAANPAATPDQLDAAGRAAGAAAVRRCFDDGTFTASTNGQTYPDLYGGYWDGKHPAGGGAGS